MSIRIKYRVRGKKFGRLTAVEPVDGKNPKYAYWRCRCSCGVEKTIFESNLLSGQSRSCGCLRTENKGRPAGWTYPEYVVWASMRKRCNQHKAKGYKFYGGRGIKVCKRWDYFHNFYKDMGPRPDPSWTLDRKDSDGDYCPENCRWATRHEQTRNMSRNVYLTYKGKRYIATDLAPLVGYSYATILEFAKQGLTGDEIAERKKNPPPPKPRKLAEKFRMELGSTRLRIKRLQKLKSGR